MTAFAPVLDSIMTSLETLSTVASLCCEPELKDAAVSNERFEGILARIMDAFSGIFWADR